MSEEHKTFWPANECFVCVFADMPIFGQCPAQDDFYLVMCSHCSQVVKPQAFQAHYGKNTSCSPQLTRSLRFSHFALTLLSLPSSMEVF